MRVSRIIATMATISATLSTLTFAIVVASITLFYAYPSIPTIFKNRLQATISYAYTATFFFLLSLVLNVLGISFPKKPLVYVGIILVLGGCILLVLGLLALAGLEVSMNPLPPSSN